MFNCCVVLFDHDMATDISRTITAILDSKLHQFPYTLEEILAWKLRSPLLKKLYDHDFLINYDVKNVDFLYKRSLSHISASTVPNWKTRGINDVPCQYKGIKGVLLES